MLDSIQQAIKDHDRYQIEIKLDYELREAKQTQYRVSTYIFVPQSLGVNSETYSKEDFYGDLQNYIRLKTPDINLRDFLGQTTSPLIALERLTNLENCFSDAEIGKQIVLNLKLISAMLKSSIREHIALIEKRTVEAPSNSDVYHLIENLIEEFLLESQRILENFRSYYAVFNLPNVSAEVFNAYRFIDESLSLLVDEGGVEIFQFLDSQLNNKVPETVNLALNRLVANETKYRQDCGYGSTLNVESDNETYIFRSSVLKKYAASVLHLSTQMRRDGLGLEQLMFSIAAGISMIFATLVAFYSQYRFGNFTLPFFIALVIGYMFKDRIKELGRVMFRGMLDERLFDRRTIINSQDGNHKLGLLKEKVTFVSEKDVPKPVIAERNQDLMSSMDNDGQAENIIRYTKEITLYTKAFHEIFVDLPLITGINDISRFDIRRYLRKMGEPVQEKVFLVDGKLQTTTCHKVYHLNFISRYRILFPSRYKLHKRLRLILNQNGIKRVEHI